MSNNEKLIEKAVQIATQAHAGQVDKYGQPYIFHVMRVGLSGVNEKQKMVGILHDVVEDSDWTIEDLKKEGFPEDILEAVDLLTKPEGAEYMPYVEKIKSNPLALSVKLNDLKDNMTLSRMPEVRESDLPRLNKYLKAWKFLVS